MQKKFVKGKGKTGYIVDDERRLFASASFFSRVATVTDTVVVNYPNSFF
jgi:hypothetical protein